VFFFFFELFFIGVKKLNQIGKNVTIWHKILKNMWYNMTF